ncbi:MAG: ABC transporter ATP-binding protein [Proteocatella sp.]
MKSIWKVFSIFTPRQQRYCFFIVICMIIGAMFEAVGIGAILPLISIMGDADFLERNEQVRCWAMFFGIEGHIYFVIISSWLLILFYIIKNMYMAWQTKLQIRFSLENQIKYAGQLLEGYLYKPYLYHLESNSAILLRNVNTGPIIIFTNIMVSIFALITELITAFTIWLMLAIIDVFTAVVVAGVLGTMMYVIIKMFRKKINQKGKVQTKNTAVYMKWLNQGLGAIKETKVLGKEQFFLEQFNKSYEEYGHCNSDFLFLNQLPRMFIETIVVSGLLLLIVVKLSLGIRPSEIVPLLGVLALAAFRLMPCANRIVNMLNGIRFQMPMFDELYNELIDIRSRNIHGEKSLIKCSSRKSLKFEQDIQIKEISFSYPGGGEEVIKEIFLTIPQGSFVGIIGESGAGKTTFVDILLGLLMPKNGDIYVDGISIYNDIRAWQENLSYVPQTIYLLDGTIRENIALGVLEDEIDNLQIEKVLKMAELYEFIQLLPNKLDTRVGERGVMLSGGQRQRIGIARALYRKPKILFLDEATSALDNETEKSITSTILKLKGEMTIIAVAHRMSTLQNCDFKIMFKNGEIKKCN